MTSKFHDILRTLQWLIPAAVTLYAALDRVFNWGYIVPVETIAAAVVAFIGVVAQHSSAVYFEGKDIIDRETGDAV